MTHISGIDVSGINENLRVRYGRDEIYTYTGTILVAVNPYKFLPIYETVSHFTPPRPSSRVYHDIPTPIPNTRYPARCCSGVGPFPIAVQPYFNRSALAGSI